MRLGILKYELLIIMLLAHLGIWAYDFKVNGLRYEIVSLDDMTCKVIADTSAYVGKLEIPSTVVFNDHIFSVLSIEDRAFRNNKDITELNLENATNLQQIGDSAFQGCVNISSVVIPSSCVKIGSKAFFGCSKLEKIVFQESSQAIELKPEKGNV